MLLETQGGVALSRREGSTVGGLLVKFLHFCLRFRTFHGLLGVRDIVLIALL